MQTTCSSRKVSIAKFESVKGNTAMQFHTVKASKQVTNIDRLLTHSTSSSHSKVWNDQGGNTVFEQYDRKINIL